jgi:hypothetical protein
MSLQFEPVRDLLPRGAMYGIDKESLGRSHFFDRSVGQCFVPRFALSQHQLSRVIMLRAWRFCHYDAPFPMRYDRATLDAECTAFAARLLARNPASRYAAMLHAAVSRSGTYMQFLAALAWAAWRTSPRLLNAEIGERFGMRKSQVCIQLAKLVKAAEDLGFPVYEVRSPTKGRPRRDRRPVDVKRALALWHAGKNIKTIAKALGDSVQRVRRSLKESGIVINKSTAVSRLWSQAGYRKKIADSGKQAWRNPATRARIVAGMHAKRASRNTVVLHCEH